MSEKNGYVTMRQDHKAVIKWSFDGGKIRYGNKSVNAYYPYNKMDVILEGDTLLFVFDPGGKAKKLEARLRNFRVKTATEAITSFYKKYGGSMGRFFEDGVRQVYHDLDLPILQKRTMRDL